MGKEATETNIGKIAPVNTGPDVWFTRSFEIGPHFSTKTKKVFAGVMATVVGTALVAGLFKYGMTAQGPTPTPTKIPVPGPTPIPTLGYESNCPIILKGYPSISSQGGQDGLPEEGQGGVELDGYSGMPIPVPIPGADSLSQ